MFSNIRSSVAGLAGLAALALVAIASPAAAQEFQVPMSPEFSDEEIRFTGELGVVYAFRWNVIAYQGQVAICGSGYTRDARLRGTIRDMARNGEIRIGTQIIPVDLRFFTRARTLQALDSTPATCRAIAPAPRGNVSVGLRFGRGAWRN